MTEQSQSSLKLFFFSDALLGTSERERERQAKEEREVFAVSDVI